MFGEAVHEMVASVEDPALASIVHILKHSIYTVLRKIDIILYDF